MNIYRQLAEGGGYNLPFLLHMYTNGTDIYLINDNKDLEFEGQTYLAASFTYSPNLSGDSTLEIEIVEQDMLIDLLEENRNFNVDVIGVFNGETVERLQAFRHRFGEADWDGDTLTLTLNRDDRLDMTFPALIFNAYNNRGNA